MKALLVKDIECIWAQRRFLIFVVLFAAITSAVSEDMLFYGAMYAGIAFVGLYLSILQNEETGSVLAFTMCLPVTRKLYVREKYVLCVIMILFGLVLGTLAFTIGIAFSGLPFWNGFLIALLYPLISAVIYPVAIPLILKFGSGRGRIISIFVMGAAVGIFASAGMDQSVPEMKHNVLIAAALLVISYILSYFISCSIMRKKEL